MGSYNVACSASGISISPKDRIYIIPLIAQDCKEIYSDIKNPYICSNEASSAIFNIATLPIECTYDDYGRVKDIKNSFTTKLLEEKYSTTIQLYVEKLLEHAIRFGDNDSNITSMFVNKEVYDHMSEVVTASYKKFKKEKIIEKINKAAIGFSEDEARQYYWMIHAFESLNVFGSYNRVEFSSNLYTKALFNAGKDILDEFSRDAVGIYNFQNVMYSMSRLIMPSLIGPQCGDFDTFINITEKILDIAKSKRSENI